MNKLIITADDFGYTKLFNKMILELIEENSIQSTSVMIDEINEDQKEQVKKLIELKENYPISIGLHIYFRNTNFKEEIEKQYNKFINIFGFEPSHIDLHKIDYLDDGYPFIQEFCKKKNLPCKNLSKYNPNIMNLNELITTKSDDFSGTNKSWEEIEKWISSLEEEYNVITFHPGYYDPNSNSGLNKERENDAKHIRKINENLGKFDIKLINFYNLNNKL